MSAYPQCQMHTIMGIDFWTTFCDNSEPPPIIYSFIAAAPSQCVVTIPIGITNHLQIYLVDTIPAGSAVTINVPRHLFYHITSTDSIALFPSNHNNAYYIYRQQEQKNGDDIVDTIAVCLNSENTITTEGRRKQEPCLLRCK